MKLSKMQRIVLAAIPAFTLCYASNGQAQQSGSQDRIQEIVVTAQKRAEKLQNVPITMSVITARSAAALGLHDTTDLASATPGLVMHHVTNTLAPSLRGISGVNSAPGDESPIAIYVDGVYYKIGRAHV